MPLPVFAPALYLASLCDRGAHELRLCVIRHLRLPLAMRRRLVGIAFDLEFLASRLGG